MGFREDAQGYLKSVARHWWVIVGSIFLVVVGITQGILQSLWPNFVMPTWVWALMIFSGLSIAQFLAWRDMKRDRDLLNHYDVNQSILSELADLRDRLISHQNKEISIGTELGQWIEQFNGIRAQVNSVLKKVSHAEHHGYDHIGVFAAYSPRPIANLSNAEYQQYSNWYSRVIRDHRWLEKFIHDYSRYRFRADLNEVNGQQLSGETASNGNQ